MSNLRLVLQPDKMVSANTPHLETLYSNFDIVYYDPGRTYSKRDVFVFDANLSFNTDLKNAKRLIGDGFKVIYDQLHDSNIHYDHDNSSLTLRHVNWFWVNEYYVNLKLGYNSYIPNRTYTYRALMAAYNKSSYRDRVFQLFSNLLPEMIYGYNKNPPLPYDASPTFEMWDRYFNPYWYDNSCFSIVLETRPAVDPLDDFLFITEKSFKPLAFKHPFMSISQPGTLDHLKTCGFETFENIFDESYASCDDLKIRIFSILEQTEKYIKQPYDSLTLEKIEHNYNLFYNKQRIDQIVNEAIIHPIIEYAET